MDSKMSEKKSKLGTTSRSSYQTINPSPSKYTAHDQHKPPNCPSPPHNAKSDHTPSSHAVQRKVHPVHCHFAAGARFDPNKPIYIPPPPPGVAPTPAQKAAAKGKPVVMTQNKASKLLMGSSGGYCFGGL
ncbi:uncharacterized protein [Dysidea avara]|uniref:uncharacterized protein n=1 Tax=Dysidea avara TaxID=196820 RepID=UPI003330D79F